VIEHAVRAQTRSVLKAGDWVRGPQAALSIDAVSVCWMGHKAIRMQTMRKQSIPKCCLEGSSCIPFGI